MRLPPTTKRAIPVELDAYPTRDECSDSARTTCQSLSSCAVALRDQGKNHALREGTTENATVCKGLLADLRERGLDLD